MKLSKVINNGKEIMFVTGKLQYIKGNKCPYFSIIREVWEYSQRLHRETGREAIGFGANREEILKHFPELQDFVDLHLSDIDGTPTYAVENGWYWNGGTEYQKYDRSILANYLRISEDAADELHNSAKTKEEFAEFVESQKERWLSEANAVIQKYSLDIPKY